MNPTGHFSTQIELQWEQVQQKAQREQLQGTEHPHTRLVPAMHLDWPKPRCNPQQPQEQRPTAAATAATKSYPAATSSCNTNNNNNSSNSNTDRSRSPMNTISPSPSPPRGGCKRSRSPGDVSDLQDDDTKVMDAPICQGVGFDILVASGWTQGQPLGVDGNRRDALTTPLPVNLNADSHRLGIGYNSNTDRSRSPKNTIIPRTSPSRGACDRSRSPGDLSDLQDDFTKNMRLD
jgi:hypothetical protein